MENSNNFMERVSFRITKIVCDTCNFKFSTSFPGYSIHFSFKGLEIISFALMQWHVELWTLKPMQR